MIHDHDNNLNLNLNLLNLNGESVMSHEFTDLLTSPWPTTTLLAPSPLAKPNAFRPFVDH